MSFPIAFYHDLDALINPRIPPLLDNLFEVFLSPEEMAKFRDRSRGFKTLTAKLCKVIPGDVTSSFYRRSLREKIMYLKQAGNMLRHFAPADLRGGIVPHTMKHILVDLGFTLDLLIETGHELRPSYEIIREIYISFYELCLKYQLGSNEVRTQGDEVFFLRPLTEIANSESNEDENEDEDEESGIESTSSSAASSSSLTLAYDFVPPPLSVRVTARPIQPRSVNKEHPKTIPEAPASAIMPQGEIMSYYKSHGFGSRLKKKNVVFLRGSFAYRPCAIVRYNGKNTQCFFPDDQSTHYIPCDFPLFWEERINDL